MYIPSAGVSPTIRQDYSIPDDLQISCDGVVVLGAPVGSNAFVDQFLNGFAAKVELFHERVTELESPQLVHTLLRLCSGVTKVSQLMRCVPPEMMGTFCATVDESMDRQVIKTMQLGNREALSKVQWAQVHLPLSMSGLGLPLSSRIKEAAFLASVLSVSRQPELLQSNCNVVQSASVRSALQTYNSLVAASDRLDYATLMQQEPTRVSQRELTARIHRHDFDGLMRDASLQEKDWARIKEQARSGSSAWMTPTFVKGRLAIPEQCYGLLLKRHVGFQFLAEGDVTLCSRAVLPAAAERRPCKERQDRCLHHASDVCPAIFTHRHNSLAEAVKTLCKAAGISYMAEVACIPGSTDVPADIYIHQGPSGTPLAVDVSVVSPLAISRVGAFVTKPGRCTSVKEAEKLARYKEHFDQLQGSIRFLPFVMSTFGSMGEKAELLMSFIGNKLSQRWVTSFQFAVNFARVRLSAAVMKFVAMNLSHALEAHCAQHPGR
jgi:hypothetical protein